MYSKYTIKISLIRTPRMKVEVIDTVRDPLDHKYLLLGGKFVFAPEGKPYLVKTSDIHK